MKIIESQAATLTNYEVYTYLQEQQQRYKGMHGYRPGNLQTLVKELLDYFQEAPSPLAAKPPTYNAGTITRLLERLRPFDLTKAEVLMIMNLRPTKPEILNTIVEELENRFNEQNQWELSNAIAGVLGMPDTEAEKQAMVDSKSTAMRQQSDYGETKESYQHMDVNG